VTASELRLPPSPSSASGSCAPVPLADPFCPRRTSVPGPSYRPLRSRPPSFLAPLAGWSSCPRPASPLVPVSVSPPLARVPFAGEPPQPLSPPLSRVLPVLRVAPGCAGPAPLAGVSCRCVCWSLLLDGFEHRTGGTLVEPQIAPTGCRPRAPAPKALPSDPRVSLGSARGRSKVSELRPLSWKS
jgi:hypothetical protein